MSDVHAAAEGPEYAPSEPEEVEEVAPQDQGDEGEEGEGDDEPAPKPVDWEKRSHSYAGQAARERSKRHAAERRAADLEARMERLEASRPERGDELLDLIAHLPDDDEDPVGDIAAVKRALKLYRQREVGSAEENRAQEQATRQVEAIKSSMADAEADFAIDHPDYLDAAKHYRAARADELGAMGYRGEALNAQLSNELFGLVRTAFQNGDDPAERVYELAKRRGFKAGGAAVNKKLDALDRASQTGVRPQARPAAGVLTWDSVAKLDGAARDKAWDALRRREMSRK